MTHLDDLEHDWLTAIGPALEPTSEDRARNRVRLLASLASPLALPASTQPPPPVVPSRIQELLSSRLLQLTAVAIISALIGGAVGFHWPTRHAVAPAAARSNLDAASNAPAIALDADHGQHVATPGELSLEQSLTPARALPKRGAPAATSHAAEVDQPRADPLIEELNLLRRAERAIRANNGLLATALLRALDQRFPKGQLLEEREAARVMANCELSEVRTRAALGSRFLAQHPQSVYAARVREVCLTNATKPSETATESR